ncbi:MAG: hypothetical protein Q8N85_05325 [Candidatus Omnitrophota bacterium]|nr:hypothetical protein [Candidatus Omnitrophota bacterium]
MAVKFLKIGQSTLEMALVLILMVLLLGGITNIWLWGSKQIVQRQMLYNQGRVLAGTPRDDYKREWPLANPATGAKWRPESLSEGRVLLDTR